jgi:chemotaxis protein methyltransferase CheR
MNKVNLSDVDFSKFKEIIYSSSGIHVKDDQRHNLEIKLNTLIKKYKIDNFKDFYKIIQSDSSKLQALINTITTNETYFFRETKHF